jgi:hypothetical protein
MGKKVLNWSLVQIGNITTTMNAKTQLKSVSLLLLRFNNKPTKLFEFFCFRWVEWNREQILNMNKLYSIPKYWRTMPQKTMLYEKTLNSQYASKGNSTAKCNHRRAYIWTLPEKNSFGNQGKFWKECKTHMYVCVVQFINLLDWLMNSFWTTWIHVSMLSWTAISATTCLYMTVSWSCLLESVHFCFSTPEMNTMWL